MEKREREGERDGESERDREKGGNREKETVLPVQYPM